MFVIPSRDKRCRFLVSSLRTGLMANLTNLILNVSVSDPMVWVAIAAGFAIVLAFLLLGRRKIRMKPIVGSHSGGHEDMQKLSDQWMPPSKSHDERRRSMRRGGVPTPVKFSDPQKPKRQ